METTAPSTVTRPMTGEEYLESIRDRREIYWCDAEGRVRTRLRALRRERRLTLADVAAGAGMDGSTLSRLESGARRLTLDHLPPLARSASAPTTSSR